jgi:hypothetical protein
VYEMGVTNVARRFLERADRPLRQRLKSALALLTVRALGTLTRRKGWRGNGLWRSESKRAAGSVLEGAWHPRALTLRHSGRTPFTSNPLVLSTH